MHIDFVAGLMFCADREHVLLINKNKPKMLRGYVNAIGGKVEKNETHIEAMVREFEEETSIKTQMCNWRKFCDLRVLNSETSADVSFFVSYSNDIFFARTMEEEQIILCRLNELDSHPLYPNLKWLIPMALDNQIQSTSVKSY